jgi:hypothetical protein
MSSAPERASGNPAVGAGMALRARRHDDAVVQAEVRRLARVLRPYGILHRDALEDAVGAARWHEGAFDSALAAAVRSGVVERLPGGFYRTAESDTDCCSHSQTTTRRHDPRGRITRRGKKRRQAAGMIPGR